MNDKINAIINQTVIANRLDSIAGEMGLALAHAAHSPIFAEACDFACCICDSNGDLVSQLSGIPILATAGSFSVKTTLRKYGGNIRPGDAFIINDPYDGGNHLPDIGVITPVFAGEELLFFAVSRAHHGDIGGATAGSYNPKATEIFQEGIRIHPTRFMVEDEIVPEVLDLILYNTRDPQMMKSDLLAQIGANRLAVRRIAEMVAAYGSAVVKAAARDTLVQGEKLVRERIAALADGVYHGEEYVDDDGFQDQPIKIAVAVTIAGDRMTIDFSGTDPQVKGFVNTSIVTTTTASGIAALWVLGSDIPRNGGAFGAIEVKAPKGCLLNPYEPAPVTFCTLTPAGEVISAIFKALEPAAPDRVPAGFSRYAGPSFYGIDPRNSRFYVGFSFCSLGSGGAMQGLDGKPYMAPLSNYGGVRAPNIESNEVQYPHLTLYHEMKTDTAGAGAYRGGAGMRFAFENYDPTGSIVMFGDGMKVPPYGLKGGQPGSLNRAVLEKDGAAIVMASKEAPRQVGAKDRVFLDSSGGGGWGRPFDRDPQKVYEDVLDEIISREAAAAVYGVVITADGIDEEKTREMRGQR